MAADLNTRKVRYTRIAVPFLSLLALELKYLYLTPSSTSQITILLEESLIEELSGWLTVNNGEIVRVETPKKKINAR